MTALLLGTWAGVGAPWRDVGVAEAQPGEARGVLVAPDAPTRAAALSVLRTRPLPFEAYEPAVPAGLASVAAPVDELRAAYLEADFLRCLAIAQDSALRRDRLLAAGARDQAARAGLLSAACLHAIGDEARARQLLRDLFATGLPAPQEAVRPDFRPLMAAALKATAALPEFPLTVTTNPEGASLEINGRRLACPSRPCVALVKPGEHVVVARALGRRGMVVPVAVDAPTAVTLTLDWATSEEAGTQVARALAGGKAPTDEALLKAVTLATGLPLALGVAAEPRAAEAALFDARTGVIVAAARAAEASRATDEALSAWDRSRAPPPLWRRPWAWAAAALVVAGATTAALLLTRDEGPRYDLVFRRDPP
ncbi:MAG: hypothetical protein KA712_11945 [Myxococcales bacterium]|nr:hypothetical protein [Myxococcales bacterium]